MPLVLLVVLLLVLLVVLLVWTPLLRPKSDHKYCY